MRTHYVAPFFTFLIVLLNFPSSESNHQNVCSIYEPDLIPGSIYQSNLQQLLINLPRNAPQNNYSYNTSYGKDTDQVYGLAMCYADATLDECNSCLTGGSTGMLKLCQFKKIGVAWYDACMIRYSDASFNATNSIGIIMLSPKFDATGQQNLTDPKKYVDTFTQLIDDLATNASKVPLKVAAGTMNYTLNGTIYALVQCTRHIPAGECHNCLASLTGLGVSGLTKQRWVTSDRTLKTLSCYVRSAFQPFYVISDVHAPWQNSPNIGIRSRESNPTSFFIIIIGALWLLVADVHN